MGLEGRKLSKSYNGKVLFVDADIALEQGLYAMQGANGIGKSTLLGILAGAIAPDAGSVSIDGLDLEQSPLAARHALSYVPDSAQVYPFLTGRQLLQFVARSKHSSLHNEVLDLVEQYRVNMYLDTRVDAMSLGTQKKFMLLAGFTGDPRVYLADEPSNGLDLRTRELLADRFRDWGNERTVLFTSHDSDFIDRAGARIIQMADLTGNDYQD